MWVPHGVRTSRGFSRGFVMTAEKTEPYEPAPRNCKTTVIYRIPQFKRRTFVTFSIE